MKLFIFKNEIGTATLVKIDSHFETTILAYEYELAETEEHIFLIDAIKSFRYNKHLLKVTLKEKRV